MANKFLERCLISDSSWKFKLKRQWYITTHQAECVTFKRLTVSNIDKDVEQLDISYTADRSKTLYTHFVKLAVSAKAQCTHLLRSSNFTQYITSRNMYTCAPKDT